MLRLSGRETDGVLISAATSPPFVRGLPRSGGRRCGRAADPKARGIVYTKIGTSEKEGIDPIRRPIGFVLRGAHHAEHPIVGASLDQTVLAAAYAAENGPRSTAR